MGTLLGYKGYSIDRTGIKKEYAIIITNISNVDEYREIYG